MITNPVMDSPATETIQTSDVTAALDAILTTDKFAASPQMSAFLRYVVEQTLIGNTRRIKAFTVGIEALGKSASFDPQTDPSVRVLAKRLRSSLDTYYLQNPGTQVFIEMKPGSYVPKFLNRSEMPVNTTAAPSNAQTPASGNQASTPALSESNSEEALANSAAPGHAAHLSVQQQQQLAARSVAGQQETTQDETADRNKSSISQLWQAYKSASKVA